jgi:Flp pilus assembly protein TadG
MPRARSISHKPSLLRRLLAPVRARGRAFARDDRGVTAVEFGILALPFFTLVFAILETAMMFFAQQVLDSAVEDASRMVRTGQAQTQGFDLAAFRNYMCGYTFDLFNCSNIVLKVETIASFAAANGSSPVETCDLTTCTWSTSSSFDGGVGRSIVKVSAYYRWPLTIVLPYFNLKNQPDNYRLISAIRVFRNEPFTSS